MKRLLCLMLSCTLLLCSCLNMNTTNNPETEEDLPQLDVWIFFDYNTPGNHYLSLWDELGKEYGYDLNVQTFASEELKDKLRISLTCDELPDIFAVWGGTFPEFLFDADACLPVQDYIEHSDMTYKEDYTSAYTDGNTYIIPCLVEAYAVTYCNNQLMSDLNLSTPTTWEDIISLVDQVNAYNQTNNTSLVPIGFGNKDSWLGELFYTMLVNREDPYALDKLLRGEIDFTDEVFLHAAQKIAELNAHNAFAPDFMQTGEVESVENFVENTTVLMPHQSTIVYYLMENMGDDAIDLIQFPDCSDGAFPDYSAYLMNANNDMTPGLCINQKTEYADAAAELCLEFSKRVNEINVTDYGYLNYTEDEDLSIPADLPEPVTELHHMVDNSKHLTTFWNTALRRGNVETFQNLTKKLYAGVLSPEAFVEAVQSDVSFQ